MKTSNRNFRIDDDKIEKAGLKWPALIEGTLIKRYKRFLADVSLSNGQTVTAHCANSGRMTECCEPGRPVWLSESDNPKRKLRFTWEIIHMPGSLVGVNTLVPNRLVQRSIEAGIVKELRGYKDIRREAPVGKHTRIDLLLSNGKNDPCYVEVKNCTLVNDGIARFPDAVTSRGLKHLRELSSLVESGNRCVMFYLIQRMDATIFRPADDIDPAYGEGVRKSVNDGVEVLVYDVAMNMKGIALNNKIPFQL